MASDFGVGDPGSVEVSPDAIIEAAEIVRDNEEPNSNTHILVGGVLVAMAKASKSERVAIDQLSLNKQDKIDDLEKIRNGAGKGSTAIQDVKTINGENIVGKGDLSLPTNEQLTDIRNVFRGFVRTAELDETLNNGYYALRTNTPNKNYNIGLLMVFADNGTHIIFQRIIGNISNPNIDYGSHSDLSPAKVWERRYNKNSPYAEYPAQGEWTEWYLAESSADETLESRVAALENVNEGLQATFNTNEEKREEVWKRLAKDAQNGILHLNELEAEIEQRFDGKEQEIDDATLAAKEAAEYAKEQGDKIANNWQSTEYVFDRDTERLSPTLPSGKYRFLPTEVDETKVPQFRVEVIGDGAQGSIIVTQDNPIFELPQPISPEDGSRFTLLNYENCKAVVLQKSVSIEQKLSELGTDIAKKYEKPDSGIPSTDLAEDLQTSISRADAIYNDYINAQNLM